MPKVRQLNRNANLLTLSLGSKTSAGVVSYSDQTTNRMIPIIRILGSMKLYETKDSTAQVYGSGKSFIEVIR